MAEDNFLWDLEFLRDCLQDAENAIIIKLSEEEAEKVQWLRYHAESVQTRQWLEVLWLLHLSEPVVEVMRIAGVSM